MGSSHKTRGKAKVSKTRGKAKVAKTRQARARGQGTATASPSPHSAAEQPDQPQTNATAEASNTGMENNPQVSEAPVPSHDVPIVTSIEGEAPVPSYDVPIVTSTQGTKTVAHWVDPTLPHSLRSVWKDKLEADMKERGIDISGNMAERVTNLTLWEFNLDMEDPLREDIAQWLPMSWNEIVKALEDEGLEEPEKKVGMNKKVYYYRKGLAITSLINEALRERANNPS